MKEEKRETLTKGLLMERLRECFELVDVVNVKELTGDTMERINVNLQIARLYVDLQETRDYNQVEVIGFRMEDENGAEFENENEEE